MNKVVSILKFILVIAIIGGIGYLFYMGTTAGGVSTVGNINLIIGDFGKAPAQQDGFKDYSSRYKAEVDKALASGATQQDKIDAIYALYRVACLAKEEAPFYATRNVGSGGAGGVVGNKDVYGELTIFTRDFKIKSEVDTFIGYYETFSVLSGVKSEAYSKEEADKLGSLAAGALGFGKSEAVAKDGTKYRDTNASNVDTTDENGFKKKDNKYWNKKQEFVTNEEQELKTKEEIEKDLIRSYPNDWNDKYGDKSKELTNHYINKNTIDKSKEMSITKKTVNGKEVFVVKFSIDCTGNVATKYSAKSIEGAVAGVVKGLVYTQLDIELEIFETGHLRVWKTAENWEADLDLKVAVLKGSSKASNNEVYSYNKKEVMDGINANWFHTEPFKL